MKIHYQILVKGLVQGVGFRPYVYRLATQMGLNGYVDNRNEGVSIVLQGSARQKDDFLSVLIAEQPDVADIQEISVSESAIETVMTGFGISPSVSGSMAITRVSPDIAVCEDCLADLRHQPHRIRYPFINCTHCGPRFSIIRDLPYDRPSTTMSEFIMCNTCRREYEDVNDRRFHAQPVACNHCGPHYTLTGAGVESDDYDTIVRLMDKCLSDGGIIALKGTGGYNLLCCARSRKAVARLRELKQRDAKPFAVMFPNREAIEKYLKVDESEWAMLNSWRRPIVLLHEVTRLNKLVNGPLNTIGALLPYLPVHYDLLSNHPDGLVFTSGNLGDEPIITDDRTARNILLPMVDLLVCYNREIYNRVDDSVVQVAGGQPLLMRRSRGYAPEPLRVRFGAEGILAFGAEKVNSFALGKGEQLILSQYIGDLKNKETHDFYTETLERFGRLFRFDPAVLVCDTHPLYFSTRQAIVHAERLGLPLLQVQHHHAHAAAVMAEYGLEGEVLAVCYDGTGLGDDGTSWGGEILQCGYSGFVRLDHLRCTPLPGGDRAAKEPWRMAVSYLYTLSDGHPAYPTAFLSHTDPEKLNMMEQMMRKNINSPLTSSVGRLFDAVSSLLGICDVNRYQAEASIRLEQRASDAVRLAYDTDASCPLDPADLFRCMMADLEQGVRVSTIAARFHHTLAQMTLLSLSAQRDKTRLNRVVLCGGVFQNRRLLNSLSDRLRKAGFDVFIPSAIPCNDSGIAIGQAAIAAHLSQ